MFWRFLIRALVLVGLVAVTASAAMDVGSAVDRFAALQADLKSAHAANDWRGYLASAEKMKALLNGAPDSLLEVTRGYVHVGDMDAAFQNLEQFVRMGQSTEALEKLPDFAPMRTDKRFAEIRAGMAANLKPVSRATTVLTLADLGLLTEDLDFDPGSKRFFITSVREMKIVAVDMKGNATDFASAPDHWPMLAIKVDSARGRVWATEVAMDGYVFVPKADWGRSAVLCYDLKTGKLLRRVEQLPKSGFGDMTLAPNGDPVVSDGDGGGVYRLNAASWTLARMDDRQFISPQTSTMSADGKHVFVPDYVRGIGVLDIGTKQVRWLPVEQRFALNGVDGLYFDRGTLLAVQNGTSPERVVAFRMDPAMTKIESETVMQRGTDTLSVPMHGVVIGRFFYFIAVSGWDAIDDQGNPKPGAKQLAPKIMRIAVD